MQGTQQTGCRSRMLERSSLQSSGGDRRAWLAGRAAVCRATKKVLAARFQHAGHQQGRKQNGWMLTGEQQHGRQLWKAGCMAARQKVHTGTPVQSRATSTSHVLAVEQRALAECCSMQGNMAAAELDPDVVARTSAGRAAVEQVEEQLTAAHPFMVSATALAIVSS